MSTVAVAHGDVDGDGDLDIVTCQNTADNIGKAEVLLNDGAGSFSQVIPLHGSNASTSAVALGDVNGDGTLDILVARAGAAIDLFLNGGTAGFTHAVLPGDNSTTTTALALGDVDGDGDLDLISASEGGNTLLLNLDGEGPFNISVDAFNVTGGSSGQVSSQVTVTSGSYAHEVRWTLECNGQNVVANMGAPYSATLQAPSGGTCTLAMSDTYGDGWNNAWWSAPAWIDADTSSNDDSDGASSSYYNYNFYGNDNDDNDDDDDPSASPSPDSGSCPDTPNVFPFIVAQGAPNGHCSTAFDDMTSQETSMMCSWTAQQAATNFVNEFGVSWTPPSGFGMDSLISEMCPNSCGACNDDASPSPSPGPDRRRLSEESGRRAKEVVAKEVVAKEVVAKEVVAAWAKEIGADHLDAKGGQRLPSGRRLSGSAQWNPSAAGWGLSYGSSASVTFTVPAGASAAALAFGDVDGDGDLDLIVAKKNAENELWINDGSGVFNRRSNFEVNADGSPLTSEELGTATTALALGDVDGDGRLDVLVGNSGSANQLLLQQSDGNFSAAPDFAGGSAETSSVAFGDMDGDGELDLLVGNGGASGSANELLMLTHCPNGGAQLHAGSSCFACPPSMGKSSPSVCLECIPDYVSEGTDGTSGPGCRKACVLAQRPLGSDVCVECKNVPGNVWRTS